MYSGLLLGSLHIENNLRFNANKCWNTILNNSLLLGSLPVNIIQEFQAYKVYLLYIRAAVFIYSDRSISQMTFCDLSS